MATKEKTKTNQIKLTLPLIALCLPLFANHQVTAENGCLYKNYLRVEGQCVDISQQELDEITDKIDDNAVQEVNQEIKEVSQELNELSKQLNDFCLEEQPETANQVAIMEDVCQ